MTPNANFELNWKPVVSQPVSTTAKKGRRTYGRSRETGKNYGQFTAHQHRTGIERKTCGMKQQRRTCAAGLWWIPFREDITVSCAPECQTGDHYENSLWAGSGRKMGVTKWQGSLFEKHNLKRPRDLVTTLSLAFCSVSFVMAASLSAQSKQRCDDTITRSTKQRYHRRVEENQNCEIKECFRRAFQHP